MLQIDQIALVAAEKVVFRQCVFQFRQDAFRLQRFAVQMVNQAVVDDLDIANLGDIQLAHPALEGDGDELARAVLHALQGALHPLRKSEVTHGLEHIIQRIHRVALHDVLRRAGNKEDNDLLVHLANLAGSFHAVHVAHQDVHEDDIVIAAVVLDDFCAVRKDGDVNLLVNLLRKPFQIFCQCALTAFFIFHQCYTNHRADLLCKQLGFQ